MSDDWLTSDPFADPSDPDALARERRRREREERRRARAAKTETTEEAPSAPVHPTVDRKTAPESPADRPADPPRGGERDFWGEGTGEPPPGLRRGRRRFAIVAVLTAMAVAVLAVSALAYRYFDNDEPPPVVEFKTITVTIPEGYSRAQTAQLAREVGLEGDYMKASAGKEGFLFPDTFELRKGAPVTDLVRLQLEDFRRRVGGIDLGYARSKNLTLRDVVTIASMVEEEAMLDRERKLIAAVIYNRLREGMPLGIDATIRFATGNYARPLTESELAVDSPYNTRLNAGLPPGPIGSPGLASLQAAARPAQVDHLFYVVKPGTCGEHAFSSSEAQFQADVVRYNEAREAAGGESPDSCG